jgi:hypothetical protein
MSALGKPQRGQIALGAAGAALLAALVLTQAVQAWAAWQRDGATLASPIANGALCSVLLLNGQVYYGELAGSSARQITLRDVYYVQTAVDPATNQPGNRLVNRRKADWHAPTLTTIPTDKVLMIEAVDAESRLAKLVAEDRAAAGKR